MSKGMINGKWYPSKEQENLIELMLDPTSSKTIKELCDCVKVSRTAYYNWFANDNFVAYYNARRQRALIGSAAKVDKALLEVASDPTPKGNADRKLFYEKLGELKTAEVKQLNVVFTAEFNAIRDPINTAQLVDVTEEEVTRKAEDDN